MGFLGGNALIKNSSECQNPYGLATTRLRGFPMNSFNRHSRRAHYQVMRPRHLRRQDQEIREGFQGPDAHEVYPPITVNHLNMDKAKHPARDMFPFPSQLFRECKSRPCCVRPFHSSGGSHALRLRICRPPREGRRILRVKSHRRTMRARARKGVRLRRPLQPRCCASRLSGGVKPPAGE